MDDLRLNPGRQDGQAHSGHAGKHGPPRRFGRVHPVKRKNEKDGRHQVREMLDCTAHGFSGGRVCLNILSIRSVIKKPLTMFAMEAKSATAPRKRIVGG